MKLLKLPSGFAHQDRLAFYLAMEEWAARTLAAEDWFFTWRVSPTVIIGRNQQIDVEVDLDYCRQRGIDLCRRRSGGGCVYANKDNIMMSCIITDARDVATVFAAFSARVADMLRRLGLPAEVTGRNDVTIGGRKVSGGAFYRVGDRNIAHSTMLFSTDMADMLRAITPSRSKLESKQVKSVESRLTTISEHIPQLSIESFNRHIESTMATGGSYTLSESDIAEVRSIENAYYADEWLYGTRRGVTTKSRKRIEGVGEIAVGVSLERDSGRVRDIGLQGDFFALTDIDAALLSHLRGVDFSREAFAEVLRVHNPGRAVANLTAGDLLDVIFENQIT